MGKILPPRPSGAPGPFSGGQIIFAVGPRGISKPNSTQPSPATSEAEEKSGSTSGTTGYTEEEMAVYREMQRKMDEAIRSQFRGTEKE
ncbi:MAG: hypothetical protein ACEB74_04860 [Desulfovibrio aminophilus]|uniref:hypothetical protein n=1 Tax=Desulfovibrio aminophilus TaxID=81425 RepID=UPI0039EBB969